MDGTEWMTTPRGKVPFYHKPLDDTLLLMAGTYEHWRDEHGTLNTFSLLTKESTPDVPNMFTIECQFSSKQAMPING